MNATGTTDKLYLKQALLLLKNGIVELSRAGLRHVSTYNKLILPKSKLCTSQITYTPEHKVKLCFSPLLLIKITQQIAVLSEYLEFFACGSNFVIGLNFILSYISTRVEKISNWSLCKLFWMISFFHIGSPQFMTACLKMIYINNGLKKVLYSP